MPAIPIYASSPINAQKASGVTPKTAAPNDTEAQIRGEASSPCPTRTYPAAQPEARPALPVPTGSLGTPSKPQPTPTRTAAYVSPPPPQPGAFPTPTTRGTNLPPPPKAGEVLRAERPQAGSVSKSPQMAAYAPLGAPEVPTRRLSATIPIPAPFSDPLGGRLDGGDLSNPPGYFQNVNASEFSSSQRAAHDVAVARDTADKTSISHRMSLSADDDDEGVWSAAKKWASAAGEGLAAAEQEVWKRINKD
ncbi:hypothetical protein EDB81DRAFT_876276 [Dactylonectria macrodidyma]|uniref:Uncharacterized protein n=1 Tax=Dactylonectria macrodidyma TaxID=307937 RepID=A0A9P9FPJ6_9HYPO|nr:hypothetical protein EDB81DRAFT_876276 [Dactylonectria macrodidyma]